VQIFKIAIELAKHFSKVISAHSSKVKITTFTIHHHHPSESHHLGQSQERESFFYLFQSHDYIKSPKDFFFGTALRSLCFCKDNMSQFLPINRFLPELFSSIIKK
jgi:hypothetical protein